MNNKYTNRMKRIVCLMLMSLMLISEVTQDIGRINVYAGEVGNETSDSGQGIGQSDEDGNDTSGTTPGAGDNLGGDTSGTTSVTPGDGSNPDANTPTDGNTNDGTTPTTPDNGGAGVTHSAEHQVQYLSLGNNCHCAACTFTGCTYLVQSESCTFVNGVCTKCGAIDATKSQNDSETHIHNFKYTPNNNGTHTVACAISGCKYEEIEACDTRLNGGCSKCTTKEQSLFGAMLKSGGSGLKINGEDFLGAKNIGYGDNVTLSISGISEGETIDFYWAVNNGDPDEASWKKFANGTSCTLNGIGSYYIGYRSKDNNSSIFSFSSDYILNINKAQIGDTTEIQWTDESAEDHLVQISFAPPTKTKGGATLPSESFKKNYVLKLYKVNSDNTNTLVEEITTTEKIHEISGVLQKESNGFGKYVCSITVISNDEEHYINSEECFSNPFNYEDVNQPYITAFNYVYDSETGVATLSGKAKDDVHGMGIYAYAFSTATTADGVEWITVSSSDIKKKDELVAFSHDITEGGKYYFYVKDGNNNITRSDAVTYGCRTNPICITKITYNNLYLSGVVKSPDIIFYEGENDIPIMFPQRKGYEFAGWHIGSQEGELLQNPPTNNYVITSEDSNFSKSINLYAGWSNDNIKIEFTAEDMSDNTYKTGKVYDKNPIRLQSGVTGVVPEDGEISLEYQWYKKSGVGEFVAVSGANDSFYDVTNVNQSGEYKVVLTVKVTDEGDVSKESSSKVISITPKAASVSAGEITIGYGDAIPNSFNASMFDFDGIITGDTDSITIGTVKTVVYGECKAYERGDGIGRYYIEPQGFSSSNYTFSYETKNTLIVEKKNVNKEGSGVDAVLDTLSYVYDGNAKCPVVTVTDTVVNGDGSSKTLSEGTDYILTYSSNTEATDSAKATITFAGNYTGTLEKTFSITKDAYTVGVTITGWKYGDFKNGNKPVVTPSNGANGNTSIVIPDSCIHYYFRQKTADDTYTEWKEATITEVSKYNAGDYQIYVSIDEMDNYSGVDSGSSPVAFTISKRNLIFKSDSEEWTFDGNAHAKHSVSMPDSATINEVTYEQDGFAGNDTYSSLSASETITDVGEKTNMITYAFTKSTNSDNYNVIKDEGVLKVVAQKLVAPTEITWSNSHAGTATWVAVTRSGLDVEYRVYLYKNGESQIKNTETTEGYYVTSSPSYDFADVIRNDSETKGLGGYRFKVVAVPAGGVNDANYSIGQASSESPDLYTVKIDMAGNEAEVSSVTIGGSKTSMVVIAGESNTVTAVYKGGYIKGDTVWVASSPEDSEISGLSIANSGGNPSTVTVKSSITKSAVYTVVANAQDERPYSYWYFNDTHKEKYQEDMTKVKLGFHVGDSLALDSYCIARFDSEEAFTAGRSSKEADSSKWTSVNGKSYYGDTTITEPGYYYIGVKDSNNQYVWNGPYVIYTINFFPGTNGQGTMPAILKIKDYDIAALPANTFTREGYAFTEWLETSKQKIYVNQGVYTENSGATLEAKWSNELYDYSVNYYYLTTEGTYEASPSETVSFSAIMGTKIKPTDDVVKKNLAGFSLDGEKNNNEITISGTGQSMDIYYKRNKYTITYSYVDINGESKSLPDAAETYYYGAELAAEGEAAKPSETGYTFVGWVYDGSGSRPSTMPSQSISATGSFKAGDASFFIHYMVSNLDGDGYIEIVEEKEERTETHGKEINFSTVAGPDNDYAKDLAGFTIEKVAAAYGSDSPSAENAGTEATATIKADDDGKLNVYYFYSRNEYKLYLNVYKGTRDDSGNRIYDAYWTFKYEENLQELTEKIQIYYEKTVVCGESVSITAPTVTTNKSGIDLVGYILADYFDWSTGSAPSKMPAGNVTVSRDYIQDVTQEYKLNVYFQNGEGKYDKKASLSYYAPAGYTARLKIDTNPQEDTNPGNDYYNAYTSQLSVLVGGFNYYVINKNPDLSSQEGLPESKLSGIVTKSSTQGEAPLELNVYFDRKSYKATVYYFYNTESNSVSDPGYIGTKTYEGIWGSNTTKVTNSEGSVTIEGFNPMDFFDTTCKADADGDGETESYRNENCMISYTASWNIDGGYWRGYEFTTVASLTDGEYAKNQYVLFGQNNSTTIYVRYMPVVRKKTFGVDIYTDPYGNPSANLVKYNYEGNLAEKREYTFRMVNKSDVFNTSFAKSSTTYASYPALELLHTNGIYDYTGGLKSGFTELTDLDEADDSTDYKYYVNSADPGVIYIVKINPDCEQFYVGKRFSINANGSIPYKIVQQYVKENNSDSSNTQIYIYNTGTFGIHADPDGENKPSNGSLTYTFAAYSTYAIYHRALGNLCGGHNIVQGKAVSLSDIENLETNCTYANQCKASRPGYTLKFYPNSNYTGDITAISSMNGNKIYYGNYTKDTIKYNKYIYYELADTVNDYAYITEGMISDDAGDVAKASANVGGTTLNLVREVTTGTAYQINDGAGNTKEITPDRIIYSYNGDTVLIKEVYTCYSFQTVNLPYANYVKTGYVFDDTQASNALNGYIEAEALTLRSYYCRVTQTLTVKLNNNASNPDEVFTYTYKNGQTVKITTPEKLGYSFKKWTFSKLTESEGETAPDPVSITTKETADKLGVTFVMPLYNLKMEAEWETASVEIPVYEYFQTNDKQYLEGMLQRALSDSASKTTGVSIDFGNSGAKSGTAYYGGGSLICVSVTNSGYEYFYRATDNNGSISASIADLFAATKTVSAKSEDEISFASYDLSNTYFGLSNAVCKSMSDVKSMSEEYSKVNAEYGMELDFYYTRKGIFSLSTVVKATDNKSVNATIAVSGNTSSAAIGDTLTITESVATGFDFKGWYSAADVIDGYEVGKDMSSLGLKSDYGTYTAVSTDSSYSFRIFEDCAFVAVYAPKGFPDGIAVALSTEQNSYKFGYTDDDRKNIHAAVKFPDNTDSAVYVKGYQWVKCDAEGTALDSTVLGISSDYKIAKNLDSGSHYYKCIVEIARKDTGRSISVTSDILEIKINTSYLHALSQSYEGTYDATYHGITVLLNTEQYSDMAALSSDDYTIWYSEDNELNDSNYSTAGSITSITKRDVKTDSDGNVIPYTVYYYVQPAERIAKNYIGAKGSATITINPKKLSIGSDKPFSKIFDNEKDVKGSLTSSDSDKHRLSYGDSDDSYYVVSGWINDDDKNENTLDFDATFNSKHVNDAGSIVLTNLKIVNAANGTTINNNYVFNAGTRQVISGYITQKEIGVTWGSQNDDPAASITVGGDGITKLEYGYKGTVHTPKATLSETPDGMEVLVSGGQTNVGDFTATASLIAEAGAEDVDSKDYKLNNSYCRFSIISWQINVKAIDSSVIYDRNGHGITSFKVTANGSESTLRSGETFTIGGRTYTVTMNAVSNVNGVKNTAITSYKNVGTYAYIPNNIQVIDSNNKNVTDNFIITETGGNLTITPVAVTVTGIAAKNKTYDGNKNAALDFSGTIGFTGLISGDQLEIKEVLVTGTFDNKDVGTGKAVSIKIPSTALCDKSTHEVSKNYVLDNLVGTNQIANATADIIKKNTTLSAKNINMTYGDDVALAGVIGTIDDEASDIKVLGKLKFIVKNSAGEEKTHEYTFTEADNVTLATIASGLTPVAFTEMKLEAGSYTVTIDTSELTSVDYVFENGLEGTITVAKKAIGTVSIKATGTELTKTYDGTTLVLTAQKTQIKNKQSDYFVFEGVKEGDELELKSFEATYDNANVKTENIAGAEYVSLTNLVIESDNYKLDSSLAEVKIPAKILPKALTLKAKDITGITYGDEKSKVEEKYGVIATGLVDGDTVADVYSSIAYTTPYDNNDDTNKHAGTYNVKPQNAVQKNGNYTISYEAGKLTVSPATVKVSVISNETSIKQGENGFAMTYGNNIDGNWFLPSYEGFKYGETAETLGIDKSDVTYKINESKTYNSSGYIIIERGKSDQYIKIAGHYTIYPQVSNITITADSHKDYTNYVFEAVNDKTLDVNKKVIHLNNTGIVKILERVYDSTKAVYVDQIRIGSNDSVALSNNGTNYDASVASFDITYLNETGTTTSEILLRDLDVLKENHDTGLKFDLNVSATYYDTKDTDYNPDNTEPTGKTVTLSYSLSDYLDLRYSLEASNKQTSAVSHISRKPLKITAKVEPAQIVYGVSSATFSNVYTSFASSETITSVNFETNASYSTIVPEGFIGNSIEGSNGEKWVTGFKNNLSTHSELATYDVYPYGLKEGSNGNYIVSYEKCSIEVVRAKLQAPTVTWDSENAGNVSFTSVTGIGDVAVDHYEMELWKKGEPDTSVSIPATITANNVLPSTTYDLLETLRNEGPGTYYVKVKAIASLTNNENHLNVDDSDAGESVDIHVATVTLKMTDDTVTTAAVDRAKNTDFSYAEDDINLAIKEDSNNVSFKSGTQTVSGVFVEGEKNIPVKFKSTGAVATGYDILAISSGGVNKNCISFGTPSKEHDSTNKTRDYSNTFNIGAIPSADEITIAIALSKEEVTISVALSFEKKIDAEESGALADNLTYNYAVPSQVRVDVSVEAGDTVTTDEYTYEYYWYIKKVGPEGVVNVPEGVNSVGAKSVFTFPTKGAYSDKYKFIGSVGKYNIYCKIVAKRQDNGAEETFITRDILGTTNGQFTINVQSAPLNITAKLSKNNWTYGEARALPTYENRPEDCQVEPVYYYSNSSDVTGIWSKDSVPSGWSKTMLTDANTETDTAYYMVAYFAPSSNYDQCITAPFSYTVSKATLGAVKDMDLCLTDSGTKKYGQLDWTGKDDWTAGVDSIYENAQTALNLNNCHSVVVPNHNIKIEYSSDGSTYNVIKEYKDVTGTSQDISDLLTIKGQYRVTIGAVPNSNNERDIRNANAGSECQETFVIGAINTTGQATKVYDGKPVVLEADFASLEGAAYTWYRNTNGTVTQIDSSDVLLSDGGKVYSPTYVNQSGDYYCIATAGGQSCVSVKQTVTITKRSIKLTTASDTKVYDGTALKNAGFDFENVADTDTATVTATGTVTNVDTVDNTYDSTTLLIKHSGSDSNIYADNYTLASSDVTLGKLSVTSRALELKAASDTKVYDGTALTKDALETVTGLASGHTLSSKSVTGSQTNVGSSDNVASNAKVADGDGNDVTPNYTITYTKGTLTITPATASIALSGDMDREYNGLVIADPVENTEGAAGGTYTKIGDGEVSFIYYKKVDGVYTELNSKPKDAGTYAVKAMLAAGQNYTSAESAYHDFEIKKCKITLTAKDSTSVYRSAINIPAIAYSVASGSIYPSDLSTLDINVTTDATTASPVGDAYKTTVRYTENDNYEVTTVDGKYTITNAELTVSSSDVLKVYDDTAVGLTVNASGVNIEDNSAIVIYYSDEEALTSENYLTKGITTNPTYKDVKLDSDEVSSYKVYYYVVAPNYNAKSGNNTITVTKRPLTITADSDTATYYEGINLQKNTYTLTSDTTLAGNDVITSVTITGSQTVAGNSANVPSTAVIKDSSESGAADVIQNYAITYVNGSLTVNKAQASLTLSGNHGKTYDGTIVENPVKSPTAVAGKANYTQVGDGTVTFEYYRKSGDTYIKTTTIDSGSSTTGGAPKYAGTYYVKAFATETTNYEATASDYLEFVILPKAITITTAGAEKVYDKTALVKNVSATDITADALATGDTIASVSITGTITNVKYDGGNVVGVDNTYESLVIKNGSGAVVTSCYSITDNLGKLKVTPRDLATDDLSFTTDLGESKVKYTGTAVGPTDINVKVDLTAQGGSNRTETLTKDTDYTFTTDTAAKKQTTATNIGTYRIEVVGKGNYQGTIYKEYQVYDDGKVDVTGTWTLGGVTTPAVNGGIYCGGVDITVTDANLTHVKITAAGGEVTDTVDAVISGSNTAQYHLGGSVTGTTYTVVGTDASGNVNDTFVITVYSTHSFTDYTKPNDIDSNAIVHRADCDHNCGAKDYIIKPLAKVTWKYDYHYTTIDGVQNGTVNVGERVLYAKVELLKDGTVVETKYLDCESTCGSSAGASAQSTGNAEYEFYKSSFADRYAYKEENGTTHTYEIRVTPVNKMADGEYVASRQDYETTSTALNGIDGAQAEIHYVPHTFYAPWKVTLTNLPKDSEGNTVCPSYVYVKVLYAVSPDSTDSGYNTITQQDGPYTKGVKCAVTLDENGNGVATGQYEVWKFIQGTHNSYYHRIQVVGYDLDGQSYDVSGNELRSICDSDHVNHTIGYDETTDKATGTIQYELGNLLPTLIFAMNDGTGKIHKVLYAGASGGTISDEEIKAVTNPSRSGYNFIGWYTLDKNGDKVAGPVILTNHSITVYAHWSEIPKEDNTSSRSSSSSGGSTVIWPTTPIVYPTVQYPTVTVPKVIKDVVDKKTSDEDTKTGDDEPDSEPDNGLKKGSIQVVVEHVRDGGTAEAPDNENDSVSGNSEKPADMIVATLPDVQDVIDKLLTPEEFAAYENGSDIVIRLTVDDSNKQKPTEGEDPALHELLDAMEEMAGDGQEAHFKSFIHLRLEKSVDNGEWQRIVDSGEPIEVVIDIPEEYLNGSGEFFIAVRKGNEYVILEDMDNNPNTITLMTSDFDGEYALIAIEKETQYEILTEHNKCFWHWFILLCAIASLLILILVKIVKEEDEEDENGAPEEVSESTDAESLEGEENGGATEDSTGARSEKTSALPGQADTSSDEEKRRRSNSRIRFVTFALASVLSIIFAILGSCKFDWPAAIVQILLTGGVETYKEVKVKQIEKGGNE